MQTSLSRYFAWLGGAALERDDDFGAVAASARQLYANLDRYLAQDAR